MTPNLTHPPPRTVLSQCRSGAGAGGHRRRRRGAGASTKIERRAHLCSPPTTSTSYMPNVSSDRQPRARRNHTHDPVVSLTDALFSWAYSSLTVYFSPYPLIPCWLLSVPSGGGGDASSTRSSLSDASAISSSSTRTYVNEASTLIIETSENGVFKHYLIPLSLQQKSKWRKKGLKLHIFGEHTFIAKHMSSTTVCEVCQKNLGRKFGKQGYVCRDCGYKCHKPCHVKTEAVCPNSTVNNMDLLRERIPPPVPLDSLSDILSDSCMQKTLHDKRNRAQGDHCVDDPISLPSTTQGNGAPSPDLKGGEGSTTSNANYLCKVQRSISFGNERVKPRIVSRGSRQGVASPPSSPPSPRLPLPPVMAILLPILKFERRARQVVGTAPRGLRVSNGSKIGERSHLYLGEYVRDPREERRAWLKKTRTA
ncbi:Serine/threonine-protein kinase D2 [Chionoecetes opilio]|uniref:Serine/threonine-protein kinase D2 n=1 Tax=Chionoecetes opilio TaxID=41210 RepID=A0A8J5CQ92_CHIOP|nr:Serine/threonine-protein kinase D2 [Chionoecetes opilio]